MDYEIDDCIDAGSEYCPCHLAETGDCILCSQLSGKGFCDCVNWKGVCIYDEFNRNGKRAKQERKSYEFSILEKEKIEDKIIILKINVTHKLASELVEPGSFVFLKSPEALQYYDVPISIMESNLEQNWIKAAIELKGTKTRNIDTLNIGDTILVRGPFWNGVHGVKNIRKAKGGNSLMIVRGIGQAPLVPVMKKLYENNNKINIIVDKEPFSDIFISQYINTYKADVKECRVIEEGILTKEFKELLMQLVQVENLNVIYCAGPDVLSYNLVNLLRDKIPFSCCNNSRMCCGEGVCGSCTITTHDNKIRRLCKLQTEPKYALKGRRKL